MDSPDGETGLSQKGSPVRVIYMSEYNYEILKVYATDGGKNENRVRVALYRSQHGKTGDLIPASFFL